MKQPLVSLCMPTYNQVQHIEHAVNSALAQTHPNFELVISDNHCTDGTSEYLATIEDPRVRVVRPERHMPTAAENFSVCVSHSRGEYITFFSSDNTLRPDFLVKVAGLLDRHSSAAFAYCASSLIDNSGRTFAIERHVGGSFFRRGHDEMRRFLRGSRAVFDTMVIRRDCYEKSGGLGILRNGRYFFELPDWDMDLRLLLTGDVAYHDEALVEFRYWEAENRDSHLRRLPRYVEEIGRMFDTTVAEILEVRSDLKDHVRNCRKTLAINCAIGVGQLVGQPSFDESVENVKRIYDCNTVRFIVALHRLGLSRALGASQNVQCWLRQRVKRLMYAS